MGRGLYQLKSLVTISLLWLLIWRSGGAPEISDRRARCR
jgi:hypothetical protein